MQPRELFIFRGYTGYYLYNFSFMEFLKGNIFDSLSKRLIYDDPPLKMQLYIDSRLNLGV